MLSKIKETRNLIFTVSENIEPFEERYNNFPQIQIKKKKKSSHSILYFLILFLLLLNANNVDINEFFPFDKKPNEPKIKWITKYLVFFSTFIRINASFVIIIDIYFIILNIIKKNEEKIIYFIFIQKEVIHNYLPIYVNELIKIKNIMINNNYNKIKNDNIIISKRNKRKIFLIRNIKRIFIKIIKYIILLNLFINIILNNKISLIKFKSYNIILKIKGTGTKNIFTSETNNFKREYYPKEVHINGYKQNDVTYSYNLEETDNSVGLIWYDLISSCNFMFRGCSDITEIDLSNFNTSNVETMQWMFRDCTSLTSINLSNLNTSKVKDMNHMFYGCSSLTSLNLSNFDTSQITNIRKMFYDCINLYYINMINFNENNLSSHSYNYLDLFYKVPNNIVVCININNIKNKIYPQISDKTCHIEDCTNNWKLIQNKLIDEIDYCINNCSIINLYEYNGKCVSQYPN